MKTTFRDLNVHEYMSLFEVSDHITHSNALFPHLIEILFDVDIGTKKVDKELQLSERNKMYTCNLNSTYVYLSTTHLFLFF